MPCLVLMLLVLSSFLLPPNAGEKIMVNCTCFVGKTFLSFRMFFGGFASKCISSPKDPLYFLIGFHSICWDSFFLCEPLHWALNLQGLLARLDTLRGTAKFLNGY